MKKELVSNFLNFSKAANFRSTVDIRDGLKPVHRRILYTLDGYKKGEFIGSTKAVGEIMGSFHPHGDSSVYDAAVRLSQPFKTRYPLVEINGNNGTVADPSSFASSRYTKMRLSPMGRVMLKDIKKDAVNMIPNFSEELLEPEYLPGALPVTLMNGTLGIGVGMASSIPPHNLRELSKAIEYKIDNPEATTKDLMNFVKGPDFPTGGTVTNPESLLEAYETGRGSVRIRADYEITTVKGKTHIIVKSVPYLVDPNQKILAPLKELYSNGYEYIEDYEVQTGKGKPFQLDIMLTKDAPVFQVIETILKETGIESSYTINLTTHIGDGKFDVLPFHKIIERYIDHNIETNNRIANFEKSAAEHRKMIVDGLIKATAEIDEVISIIKKSSTTQEASTSLQKRFSLNEEQSKAILAMRLSQLTKLDVEKLISEKLSLEAQIEELQTFLLSREMQLEKVKGVIKDISSQFGDARRTEIKKANEVGEVEEVVVFLTEENEVFAMKESDLPVNRRNTKGKVFENIISAAKTNNNGSLWIITDDGYANLVNAASIGLSDTPLKNNVENLGIRGKAVQIVKPRKGDYIVTKTKEGTLKKSSFSDYNMNGNFKLCKVREGESLESMFIVKENDSFVMILENNKYVMFNEKELSSTGTNTIGVKGSTQNILSFDLIEDSVLFVDVEGNAKKVQKKDLKESGRRTSGLACGDAVFVSNINKDFFIYVWGSDLKMIRIPETSVTKTSGVTAKGVILYNGKIAKILTN